MQTPKAADQRALHRDLPQPFRNTAGNSIRRRLFEPAVGTRSSTLKYGS
jgi:hypothetical protein